MVVEDADQEKDKSVSGVRICLVAEAHTRESISLPLYKITADGDCSHEIKRHLLLGRKVMTNLDGILKSRDITLLTEICIVKAMVFFSSPV